MHAEIPELKTISVDGAPLVGFSPRRTEYHITLPYGRPRIPRISAEAESGCVTVYQATFSPTSRDAEAKIEVTCGDVTVTYRVVFTKSKALGFVLQYDDRYLYRPAVHFDGEHPITFESSDPSVLSVDENGLVTALTCTDKQVVVRALVEGEERDRLTVDRIDRAQLAIFLIIGQSNSAGTLDKGEPSNKDDAICPLPGTAYCIDAKDKGEISERYDLCIGRRGYSSALCERWYSLSGEKALAIQSAVSGSPIERWERDREQTRCFYHNTQRAYDMVMAECTGESAVFEVVRRGYFWCQGETGQLHLWKDGKWNWDSPVVMQADEYYDRFMQIHKNLIEDMQVEFGSIMLVRTIFRHAIPENQASSTLSDLIPVRASQYAINNTTPANLAIMSRIGDIARPVTSPNKAFGFNFIGPENLHYTQFGYNAQGYELAENTFASVSGACRAPDEIEVLAFDGHTRLADGDTVMVPAGGMNTIAAIVLPLYTSAPKITYTVTEGAEYCTINIFGQITFSEDAAPGSRATVLIRSESGLARTIYAELQA